MKWEKLGQIFNPTAHKLHNNCFAFAKSPQAIVFDDFVRIYFSTIEKDLTGKLLSRISYVDFDKKFKKIIGVANHEIIPLGGLGCFDEHGIFPFNVLRYKNKIYAYTSGWSRRVSVSVETGIGLAISSDDGCTFHKVGAGPVLTSSLQEPYLVVDGFVKIYDDKFHMWYIYGTDWEQLNNTGEYERTYKIGHATSIDGVSWIKEDRRIIADKYKNECQALPTVIKIKNRYHMLFAHRNSFDFRKNSNNSYRIGYAYSDDLINWIREDDNAGIDISAIGWDAEMMTYPHIFKCDNDIYLLYNGNEFGRYGFGIAKLENL